MTPVAWQPADGVLQVLFLGVRLAAAGPPSLPPGAPRPAASSSRTCASPADAAAARPAGAGTLEPRRARDAGDVPGSTLPRAVAPTATPRWPRPLRAADAESPPPVGPARAERAVRAGATTMSPGSATASSLARVLRHAVERRRTQRRARPERPARRADRPAEPHAARRPHRQRLLAASRAPAASSPSCASPSTASSSSTTRSATRPATCSSSRSPSACRRVMRPSDTVARLGGDVFADPLRRDGPRRGRRSRSPAACSPRSPRPSRFPPASTTPPPPSASPTRASAATRAGVLREADAAMTAAKRQGGGCAHYEAEMGDACPRRLALHNELHGALERSELVLHYQPQVPLGGGAPDRRRGARALAAPRARARPARRLHPRRRGLRPDRADRALGPARGLRAARALDGGGRARSPRWTWASTSPPASSRTPASWTTSRRILDETGADPARVCLEITETAVLDDVDLAGERLAALKALGVRLAIDDFGTGYSSLSQLGRFPVDVLKIDRSFVQAMGEAARPSARPRRRGGGHHAGRRDGARPRGRGRGARGTGRGRCARSAARAPRASSSPPPARPPTSSASSSRSPSRGRRSASSCATTPPRCAS